ncbi:MAG TPA: asparagine synthase-related protein [Blastocatellia bacterium]|nr:asparagine synthase-related protein [Blastocatellia bacterium]
MRPIFPGRLSSPAPPIEPDWHIAWQGETITLFHAQPALSPNQRYLVTGDLWLSNRADLARTLKDRRQGEEWTDAQIVACLWQEHGRSAIEMLEGMFGLIVWDGERQELWLARDRVGARTLYYTINSPARWIAPRLRSLAGKVAPEIDPVALRDYLCCAFVPGERTLFRDIREVRPGAIVRLPGGEAQTYWAVREQIEGPEQPIQWHAERLRSLLNQVVREYLPAGAPVGAYLSGGLDSSCIVALAAELHSHPVHTYSIHFGDETPNELEFSSLVAAHCRTEHRIIEITTDEMWELLPETMALLDDPIGDPLTVPNLILGRAAKQSVDVILNGEGGDPCFGGPKNQPMLLTSLYRPAIAGNGQPHSATPDLDSAYLASFQKCSLDLPRLLRPDVWQAAKSEPSVFAEDLHSAASYLNRLLFINIKYKGADHILTKVNNLARATGLLGLSPLFDQRVVEMSLRIPPQHKLDGAREKAVLKLAVRDLLPESILTRPKSGMMVPVQLWFRKYWQRQARALLLSRRARIRPYLDQSVIRDWLKYQGDTWSRYGVKLWLLVSLELWLQAHLRD